MTKEALNALWYSQTQTHRNKMTSHKQTYENQDFEHLLGRQRDNTGVCLCRQKREARGRESNFKVLWLLVNCNLNIMLNSWGGWGSKGWGAGTGAGFFFFFLILHSLRTILFWAQGKGKGIMSTNNTDMTKKKNKNVTSTSRRSPPETKTRSDQWGAARGST